MSQLENASNVPQWCIAAPLWLSKLTGMDQLETDLEILLFSEYCRFFCCTWCRFRSKWYSGVFLTILHFHNIFNMWLMLSYHQLSSRGSCWLSDDWCCEISLFLLNWKRWGGVESISLVPSLTLLFVHVGGENRLPDFINQTLTINVPLCGKLLLPGGVMVTDASATTAYDSVLRRTDACCQWRSVVLYLKLLRRWGGSCGVSDEGAEELSQLCIHHHADEPPGPGPPALTPPQWSVWE